MDAGVNSGVGYSAGEFTVQFERFPNNSVHFQLMGGEMSGLAYGERIFSLVRKSN